MMTRRMVGLSLVLALSWLGLTTGCGRKPASGVSRGGGEPLYQVTSPEKTTAALEHGGKRSTLDLPPEARLFDSDIIENTGTKAAIVSEIRKGHKFTLAPSAKVQVNDQRLTLFQGGTRFEFRKIQGEFKIVLPNSASLGIRGTEFAVVLQAGGQALIRMFEGKLEIERAGKVTALEAPQSAVLGESAAAVQIVADPTQIPPAFRNDPAAPFLGLDSGSEEESVGRTRKSNY